MTIQPFLWVGHQRLHAAGEPCDCPPDWPRDLSPGACMACYDAPGRSGLPQGVDRPAEQCMEHKAGRIDEGPGKPEALRGQSLAAWQST